MRITKWRVSLVAQIHLIVGILVALVLATAAGSILLSQRTENSMSHLEDTVRPAQSTASELTRAYSDQADSVRGFLLTGNSSFLQTDNDAQADATRLQAELRTELGNDPASVRLLAEINSASQLWRQNFSAEIKAVQTGEQAPAQRPSNIPPADTPGEQSLQQLRARLADLQNRILQIAGHQTAQIAATRSLTDTLTAATCLLAGALAASTIFFLRRALTGPLTRLVDEVAEVANGDLGHAVRPRGPQELATTATAVERMRVRILEQTKATSEAQQQLARYEESERIARGLHDQVIQRLVGVGMTLQSTAGRHPELAGRLSEPVNDLDRTIQELRTVIFGLSTGPQRSGVRGQVLDVVRESEHGLGFAPRVRFSGVIDPLVSGGIAGELLPSLRECLSNVARHARASHVDVSVLTTDDELVMEVRDDGVGLGSDLIDHGNGLANLRHRAERLGGTCSFGAAVPRGTVVDWRVPLDADDS